MINQRRKRSNLMSASTMMLPRRKRYALGVPWHAIIWYTFTFWVLTFAALFSTCVYAVRHGEMVLKTDYELCQDLASSRADPCDLVD